MTVHTDGYDPDDDPLDQFRGLTDKHARAMAARELYDRGVIGVFGGGGGGSGVVYGGGGGGGYSSHVFKVNTTDRLIPDLTQISADQLRTIFNQPTPEERQEMTWSNPEAADIAREILQDEKREGLREKITEAVAHYRAMLADAHCGSVFSFMKENDEGKHYWYAAIKNGDKWYTTAQNPRVIDNDDKLIEWLVGLGAHESKAAELTEGAAHRAAMALGPIDTSSTDA